MSQKFKKHYTGFNRKILAEFMSKPELERLDEKYNEAKLNRVIAKAKLSTKEIKHKEIVDFFKLVCQGIKDEYNKGASHRSSIVDINTLKSLLKSL